MKKKILILSVLVLTIGIILFSKNSNKISSLEEEIPTAIKQENTLSMMLETEAGSGEYEMTTASSWPTDGYVFNETLSKCENGSELSWDDTNKKVLMSGNVSDKCYIYFDVKGNPTFTIIDIDSTEKTYTFEEGMTWKEFLSSDYAGSDFSSGCQGTSANLAMQYLGSTNTTRLVSYNYICNTDTTYDFALEQDKIQNKHNYYVRNNNEICSALDIG